MNAYLHPVIDDLYSARILSLAANLANPSESDIAPSTELVLGGKPLAAPEGFTLTRRHALWSYLTLAALLLLSVEWMTYHRRVTV